MNSYHEYLKEEGNLPLAIFDVGKKMQLQFILKIALDYPIED